jgi:hypothetical protein
MARMKTRQQSIRTRLALAQRLSVLQTEVYGNRAGPQLAKELGISVRTWYNYLHGVTIPGEVLLRLIIVTCVEPRWLLHGDGPIFRHPQADRRDMENSVANSIYFLLRTALQLLENRTLPSSKRNGISAGSTIDITQRGRDDGCFRGRDATHGSIGLGGESVNQWTTK